jgi:copper/silver efflux system protein
VTVERDRCHKGSGSKTLSRLHEVMTVAVDFIGLLPVMLATGAGADLTKRIAAPMIAGMFFSFALELFIYPAIYAVWKWHTEVRKQVAL